MTFELEESIWKRVQISKYVAFFLIINLQSTIKMDFSKIFDLKCNDYIQDCI